MQVLFNPRCTKCRILRKELDENDVAWDSVLYLDDGLDRPMVERIFAQYEGNWHNLVRTKEKLFKEKGLSIKTMSKKEAIDLVLKHPVLIQRPIVLQEGRVLIARDAEAVMFILDGTKP